jgi:uncharacterized protein YndB with AHSA1/START domain
MTARVETGVDGLDLVLSRLVAAPRAMVWRAWTEPELLKQWFAPAPFAWSEVEIDVRPGGMFRGLMRGPEGEEFPLSGVYLEVVEGERLVTTDVLEPGWRPSKEPFMTTIVTLADEAGGTRYIARVLHKSEEDVKRHVEMGFFDGWGKCTDQLEQVAKSLAAR